MSISNSDKDEAVELLLRDIETTIGKGYEEVVRARAVELLTFLDDRAYYVERLAENIQQYLHDCRIDTEWPRVSASPQSSALATAEPLGMLGCKDRYRAAGFAEGIDLNTLDSRLSLLMSPAARRGVS